MDRKKSAELLEYIEEQNKTLQKYKSRLHDVVESYKNLSKEKEALQESVKFLTEGKHLAETCEKRQEVSIKENEVDTAKEENSSDGLNALKTSLRILTTEKVRIENEMKADRKRLLKENEDLKAQLDSQVAELNRERSKFDTIVRELRKQIRDQQKEREKEQQDHAVMLKELQSLVADERCAKEKFEQQLESLKFALEKLPDKRFEYEKRINELQSELSNMKELLEAAEGEKKDLPSLLRQLQQEMYEMKERHQEAVEREYKRANEAEEKLKALASLSEQRAASLEQRLCELSHMVGNYDKLRQQDQMAIQRLKERVAQLDQENSALANTVAGAKKMHSLDMLDVNLDNQDIVDKISTLKSLLHLAIQKSEGSPSLSGLLGDLQKDHGILNPHVACEKECDRLKHELEQTKQKLQSAKAIYTLESESQSELILLKREVKNLEEKLETCRIQYTKAEEQHQNITQKLERIISDMKASRNQELSALKTEYQNKQMELEQQVQKQRERSMTLLEDKEAEIAQLKKSLQMKERQLKKFTESSEDFTENWEEKQLTDMLSNSASSSTRKGKVLLYYTQEMARKDVEITNLRRSRLQAETALRELQQNILIKEENYQNDIDILKSQIKRLESVQVGANMEYLKNVIFRFIKSNDPNDQSHMINAIAAILHFTPLELQEIKAHRQSGTWSMQRI